MKHWEQLIQRYPPISRHLPEMEIPYIEAKFYGKERFTKRRIVMHTTENPQTDVVATNIAVGWSMPWSRRASCHFIVGSEIAIQCVPELAQAWHAKPDNDETIGVELVGAHNQRWESEYAIKQLELAAKLVASLANKHDIPIVRPDIEDLPTSPGIVGHHDITRAFKVVGGHIDPGPWFPWEAFLLSVTNWSDHRTIGPFSRVFHA